MVPRARKLPGDTAAIGFDEGRLWLDGRRVGVDAWAVDALAARSRAGASWLDEAWRAAGRALAEGPFVGEDARYGARIARAVDALAGS